MSECDLISSMGDLKAAETLLLNHHYCQAVLLSSQSVEKSLKSLLALFKGPFNSIIHAHSATQLVEVLNRLFSNDIYYSKHHEQFLVLCKQFEALGASSWMGSKPLSIRARYFQYRKYPVNYYMLESFPGVVFTKDIATEAFVIAKELFVKSQAMFNEKFNNLD